MEAVVFTKVRGQEKSQRPRILQVLGLSDLTSPWTFAKTTTPILISRQCSTARQKIQSQFQIFRYGRSIFCLPHWPNFSDIFDLCHHWVSIVRALNPIFEGQTRLSNGFFIKILALCTVSIQERIKMVRVQYEFYMHKISEQVPNHLKLATLLFLNVYYHKSKMSKSDLLIRF